MVGHGMCPQKNPKRIGWWVFVLFLLAYVPFQALLRLTLNLPRFVSFTDEVMVVILCLIGLRYFLVNPAEAGLTKGTILILSVLGLLTLVGLFSGIYNANPIIVTVLGTFDYVKNFLIIIPLAYLMVEKERFIRLYTMLHYLAVFLCIIAILQEAAFFLGIALEWTGVLYTESAYIRLGIFRVPSLMSHPRAMGLYALLFFILDITIHKRVRWQNVLLATGIFLSVSRVVWVAFFLTGVASLVLRKNRVAILWSAVSLLMLIMVFSNFYKTTKTEMITQPDSSFRGYTLKKSVEVWRGSQVVGIGPGRYGGVVSFLFPSPTYKEVPFSSRVYNYTKLMRSLDQFWPQCLAEIGILGVSVFCLLLFVFWWVPYKLSRTATDSFQKDILFGLSLMPVVMGIYFFGSGLNIIVFLFTYTSLLGLSLGIGKARGEKVL